MVNKWRLNNLIRCLSPPCLLCGGVSGNDRAASLCDACRHDLPVMLPQLVCRLCALPLETGMSSGQLVCGRCLTTPPPWSSCISVFHYQDPVASLIQSLKFNGQLIYASLLGDMMATVIAQRIQVKPDLLVPVPLHRIRLRERGYNQSYQLARPVSSRLGIRLDYLSCARTRQTDVQSLLPAHQRRQNMAGAFEFSRPRGVRHVAIIDDVMTTSSTVSSLCDTLQQQGVEVIDVWVCARADRPGPRNPF